MVAAAGTARLILHPIRIATQVARRAVRVEVDDITAPGPIWGYDHISVRPLKHDSS